MCDYDGDYSEHLGTRWHRSIKPHSCISCELNWPAGVVMEYSSWAGGGGVVINTVCPVCAFATKWAHEDSIVHFCAGDPIEWGGSIDDEEDEEDDDNKSDRLTEWDLFRYFVSCMVANVRPSLDRCREIREQCPNLPPYTKIPDNYLTTEFWQTKRGTSVKTGWVPPSEWRIPTLSSELS